MSAQKLAVLQDWGMSLEDATVVAEAIEDNKKIIVVGAVGSGKTKMLNALIRVAESDKRFEYESREKISEYGLEPDNQSKLAAAAEIADYIVADEPTRPISHFLNLPQSLLATQILTTAQDDHQFDRNLAPMADLIITMTAFKKVWNVRKITIHDRLLHGTLKRLDAVKNKPDSFLVPYAQLRLEWLDMLDDAERAAVQLGHMNRTVENGGLGGWYQADGAIIVQDLPDLFNWAEIGSAQGIRGFEFLKTWLLSVQNEYLPDMQVKKSAPEDPVCAERLTQAYYGWKDRMERFDELLTNMLEQKS